MFGPNNSKVGFPCLALGLVRWSMALGKTIITLCDIISLNLHVFICNICVCILLKKSCFPVMHSIDCR